MHLGTAFSKYRNCGLMETLWDQAFVIILTEYANENMNF